jgi:hypothetical protein
MTGALTTTGFTSTGIDDNATSTAITIDASENVGIGSAPESDWKSNVTGLQIGNSGSIFARSDSGETKTFISENVKWTADAQEYINNGYASMHQMDAGTHAFKVAPSGTADTAITWTTAMTIANAGDVTVGTGNLVIGTSGKGIDFSAVSDGSRSVSSNVLDDYEEGTWTPSFASTSITIDQAKYVKIGNMVNVMCYITIHSALTGHQFSGFPYASSQYYASSIGYGGSNFIGLGIYSGDDGAGGRFSSGLPSGTGNFMFNHWYKTT